MKSLLTWVIVILLIVAAAGTGYWLGHRGSAARAGADEADTGTEKKEPPVAAVQVTPIRQGTISEQLIAYGTIIAPVSEVRVISVPFEARTSRLLVSPGQVVTAGQPLVEVEGSSATQLMYQEAQNAVTSAQRDLNLAQQRFQQHLATNTDLFTAQTAMKTAQVRLQNLEQSGAGGPRQLKSEVPGVVSKVDVQTGQVVPAGGPLIEIAANNQIIARLGVDPEDVASLKLGQPVMLNRVSDASPRPINGTIRLIGQQVDPATHLVPVMVQPPANSNLLLDDFVSGTLTRSASEGLIVPRDAVLPAEDNKLELFTVKDGKAVKHDVRVGAQTDRQTQVISDDLKPGDLVVVSGNLELEDGMAVNAETAPPPPTQPEEESPSTTQPAETQPATAPATNEAASIVAPLPSAVMPIWNSRFRLCSIRGEAS